MCAFTVVVAAVLVGSIFTVAAAVAAAAAVCEDKSSKCLLHLMTENGINEREHMMRPIDTQTLMRISESKKQHKKEKMNVLLHG